MLNTRGSLSQRVVPCRRSGIDLWHDRLPVHPALPPREDRDLPPRPGGQSLRRAHAADRRAAARARAAPRPPRVPSPARRPDGRSRCTPPTTAPTCPATLVAAAGRPRVRRPRRSTRPTPGSRRSLALFSEVFGRVVLRRPGAPGGRHRALRAGLRQRLLGRHPAGVRRRRRHGVRPVHQAGRRARATSSRHAVTQFTANLTYQGQSGALNESVSDVFGSCLKQRLLGADRSTRRTG